MHKNCTLNFKKKKFWFFFFKLCFLLKQIHFCQCRYFFCYRNGYIHLTRYVEGRRFKRRMNLFLFYFVDSILLYVMCQIIWLRLQMNQLCISNAFAVYVSICTHTHAHTHTTSYGYRHVSRVIQNCCASSKWHNHNHVHTLRSDLTEWPIRTVIHSNISCFVISTMTAKMWNRKTVRRICLRQVIVSF